MARAWMSWSSGKDSLMALHRARVEGIEVTTLLTTFNEVHDRVAIHGVRRTLAEAQADALGLALHSVPLPDPCTNEQYKERMAAVVERALSDGVDTMVFGDLFLEDIRAYREEMLDGTGLRPHFPLWGLDTAGLAAEMLAAGLQAVVTCVDTTALDASFAGRRFDARFLDDLPLGVDPCGERGEFHTFAYAGPGLAAPIAVRTGEVVDRGGFVFCDVLERDD